jgi:hypothetical protein
MPTDAQPCAGRCSFSSHFTGVTYRPFGPAQGYNLGNGPQTYTRTFDLDGRITSYTVGSQTVPVNYDDAGRIVGLGGATYG